ncbi:uncharacterized protein BKCO1_4000090 [Diplodia corticola]|uniref:Uncharacterized protein n=1 Tax=Diplodia corticola TaxID=236234 RepID=A0A1J9RUZ0_9PEZI|nr:uncharacterized protein BKCO1_4000090 [Diplodia corticola]OJD32239.1 hypothetical protein BKCO1_4000090 [Diplodia corticola]
MSFLKSFVFGGLFLFQLTEAIPFHCPNGTNTTHLQARKLFQLADGHVSDGIEKRAMFNVDQITDEGKQKALTQGLKDAVEIAKVTLDKMDKDRHADKIKAWFGEGDGYYELVQQVFRNFVGDNDDHEGADVLGNVIVHQDDYNNDLGSPFCSIVKPDGKRGTAYYKKKDGKPGMHFCDRYYERQDAEAYLADKCSGIPTKLDTDHIGRAFQGANVLHEFMHYPKVGLEATGKQITDIAYGAWNCYNAKNDDAVKARMEEKNLQLIHNADTYVYYAMHIYLEHVCDRTFDYPDSTDK